MTAFSRALLVDSDQIVLRSYDSIFDGYDPLAVGPSNFRADKAFATGTMLLRPDFGEYTRLLALLGTLRPEYDNADMVSGRPSRLAVMVQLLCIYRGGCLACGMEHRRGSALFSWQPVRPSRLPVARARGCR